MSTATNTQWRESTWGEEISLEYGKALRGYDTEGGKYRVFGSNGPIGWHSEYLTPGPGVILGRKGAYRGVEYWRDPFWVIDTAYYVVPKTELDHRWLYYAIKHYKLGEIDDGSPIPSTTRAAVYVKELQVPPLREQQAIACILGALDDKIELNRKRNRTLEALARAIFQSWFVDFDPVRAKIARQHRDDTRADDASRRVNVPRKNPSTGVDGSHALSPELAALFPDRFEDSPLGPIPKGWRVGTLGEVAHNPRRGITAADITPGTPYIALEHMPRRSIALADWSSAGTRESNKFEFHQGEILFGKLRPYFHKVGIAPVDGVCSTDILVIVPKQPEWFGFCAGHFSSDAIIQHADRTSTGTKMPRTNWNDLARFEVIVDPENWTTR